LATTHLSSQTQPKQAKRAAKVRDAAVAIASVFFTLAAIEGGMRLAGMRYSVSFFTKDSERGYAYRPNAEGWWMGEGHVYVRMNGAGYHDTEHTLAKAPGIIRIAVFGSSYVGAPDVRIQDNFISLLQREINQRLGRNAVETLNFGVSAYSPPQSYITLEQDGWRYHPDVVIFAVTPVDLVDSCRETAFNTNLLGRPYYDVGAQGKVVRDALSRRLPTPSREEIESENRWNQWISRFELTLAIHSALQTRGAGGARVDGLGQRRLPEGADPRDSYRRIPDYQEVLPSIAPPGDGPVEQCWRVFDALLAEMKAEAHQHGAGLWILPIGFPVQENPDPRAREAFARENGLRDLYYWDKRTCGMAKARSLACIDLPPQMAAYASEHHIYLHGFPTTEPGTGHWNEHGHAIAANLIASQLLSQSRTIFESGAGQL
jgi:hypothetical protein